MRTAYILNQRIVEFLTPKFEKLEDRILKNKSISLFCGNIIVIARAGKTKASWLCQPRHLQFPANTRSILENKKGIRMPFIKHRALEVDSISWEIIDVNS